MIAYHIRFVCFVLLRRCGTSFFAVQLLPLKNMQCRTSACRCSNVQRFTELRMGPPSSTHAFKAKAFCTRDMGQTGRASSFTNHKWGTLGTYETALLVCDSIVGHEVWQPKSNADFVVCMPHARVECQFLLKWHEEFSPTHDLFERNWVLAAPQFAQNEETKTITDCQIRTIGACPNDIHEPQWR